MSLLSESAELSRIADALIRDSATHELRLVQASEDMASLRPVRWCEHCQRAQKLCWFHNNFTTAQARRRQEIAA